MCEIVATEEQIQLWESGFAMLPADTDSLPLRQDIAMHIRNLKTKASSLRMLSQAPTRQDVMHGGDEIRRRIVARHFLSRALAHVWNAEGRRLTETYFRTFGTLVIRCGAQLCAEIDSMKAAAPERVNPTLMVTLGEQSPDQKAIADRLSQKMKTESAAWRVHTGR